MFAIIDAARSYMHLGMARLVATRHRCLLEGDRGRRLEHVAPHLVQCDGTGRLAKLVTENAHPGAVGVVLKTDADFDTVRKHLRRMLSVRRERDGRRVIFRYYDPRVLRSFLPSCNQSELAQFFGPIDRIEIPGESPGSILGAAIGEDECLKLSSN